MKFKKSILIVAVLATMPAISAASYADDEFTQDDTPSAPRKHVAIRQHNENYKLRVILSSEPLPTSPVEGVSFDNMTVSDALKTILKGTGISLSLRKGYSGTTPEYARISTNGVSGSVAGVVEALSKYAGFFYSLNGNVLYIYPDVKHQVVVPDASIEAVAANIESLGGFNLAQEGSSSLVFYADRKASIKIKAYLKDVLDTGDITLGGKQKEQPKSEEKAKSWELNAEDGSVSVGLARWAKQNGWRLVWESPVDFPISASAKFSGSFYQVIEAVMKSLSQSDNPVRAKFYDGNKVVRVIPMNGEK